MESSLEDKRAALAIAEQIEPIIRHRDKLTTEYRTEIARLDKEIEVLQEKCPHPNDMVIYEDLRRVKDHALKCNDCHRRIDVAGA